MLKIANDLQNTSCAERHNKAVENWVKVNVDISLSFILTIGLKAPIIFLLNSKHCMYTSTNHHVHVNSIFLQTESMHLSLFPLYFLALPFLTS